MALTLRRNKSLPLTHDELDDNFEYLSSSLASITVSTSTGSFLYSGSFDGSSTVTLYSADTNYNLDLSTLSGGGGVSITDLNNFTGSAQISLNALNAATGSYLTENLYTADGTLSGERTVTQNGNGLTFNGQGAFNTFDVSSGGRFLVSGSTNVKIDGLQSGTQANIVGIDSNGQLYVQATSSIAVGGGGSGTVTSVTVSGSNGLTGSGTVTSTGTITLQHTDTSTQSSVNNSGNTFIQDVTLDGFGHVTALTSATVGATQVNSTAVYAEAGTGFDVHNYTNYTVVNINSTDIQASSPKQVAGANRLLAIATMEVGNPGVGLQNCVFSYELYNSTQTATVAGSQGSYSGYLLPGGEGQPNDTFTFTLPIADENVADGDTIQLRAKAYSVGTYASASIYYASLTLLDME